MWTVRQCLRLPLLPLSTHSYSVARLHRRLFSVKHETDEYGIPLKPTWSVHELLSSYPKPTLSSATLTRLHKLSALQPPEEGSIEQEKLKGEMEELIRLVEAVKLVDTQGVHPTTFELQNQQAIPSEDEPSGRLLLQDATRTLNGFYVVDSDKRRL
ncbi:hypothetical protein C0993_006997 [Termitomyces sp. T159_Od127]|nr:hypothetical protein C0993_006997 [Termitomyces sp. T159_Od127]